MLILALFIYLVYVVNTNFYTKLTGYPMFFILSKLFLFLLSPINWIIFCLIAWMVVRSKKRKKRILVTALIIFLLFSNSLLLNVFARYWQPEPVKLPPGKTYSSIILLGGLAGGDKPGEGFFNNASDRFIQAVKLYKQGRAARILITGGSGNLVNNKFKEAP